jgi:hypothetical protein
MKEEAAIYAIFSAKMFVEKEKGKGRLGKIGKVCVVVVCVCVRVFGCCVRAAVIS